MIRKWDALYPVQNRDVPRPAAVLVDAFEHDPIWKSILTDATRAQRIAAFEAPLRYCLRYGQVCATSKDLEGVAAWVPGDLSLMTPWRMLRSGAMWAG